MKHATASMFLLANSGGWELGLIRHPRLGRLMCPGGHVEAGETPLAAARREVAEETGMTRLRLLPPVPVPAGFPHARVAQPWWVTEQPVGPDSHLNHSHVHIDHQYVGFIDGLAWMDRQAGECPVTWHLASALPAAEMWPDTVMLARQLFTLLSEGRAG